MPQSIAYILLHLVFSTKDRLPHLNEAIRSELHPYLATVARNAGCEALRVGGASDHVHLAIRFSRTVSVASLIEELKTGSSKWLKKRFPNLPNFSWQRGYSAFSISPEDQNGLLVYIENQEEHHRIVTFQDEYRALLTEFGVEYDERYMWD
ncbi:MAG TPA: IS200/IS605 family transposase [Candidatus Sumerlaeota bacterium]|nr:IS200/IS605 family transposase [Candidatus Sumerlaeota bacterium]